MPHIVDERGYNQIFAPTLAQQLRSRRRGEAIAAEIKRAMLPAGAAARILEIGCGTGELAAQLSTLTGAEVLGVDLSPKFIAEAQRRHRRPGLDFAVLDLTQPPPAALSEKQDFIVGNGILHHLYHHLDTVLPALARWLAPGGRLIFWEPNLQNPYVYLIFSFAPFRRRARLEPDEMAFTSGFIRQKLARAGYVDIEASTRDFLIPTMPARLIKPTIAVGAVLERIPGVRRLAQSVFLCATRPKT